MVDDRIRKILPVTRQKHIEKAFADRPARSPESLERTNITKTSQANHVPNHLDSMSSDR
jgi:hypothetical protein